MIEGQQKPSGHSRTKDVFKIFFWIFLRPFIKRKKRPNFVLDVFENILRWCLLTTNNISSLRLVLNEGITVIWFHVGPRHVRQ